MRSTGVLRNRHAQSVQVLNAPFVRQITNLVARQGTSLQRRPRHSLDPHVRKVGSDLGFELVKLGVKLADRLGVPLAELLDASHEMRA